MTDTLVLGRRHLAKNRRMIIGRSLAAAVAGVMPVPLVEDWIAATINRGTIRRVAGIHQVDVDEEALRVIASGPARPPQWVEIGLSGLFLRLASRTWRRMIAAYFVFRRVRVASESYVTALLFDHYCARLHVGLGVDAAAAQTLRAAMVQAMALTPGRLDRWLLRRGAAATVRTFLRMPLRLANLASGGAVRRLLSRGDEEYVAAEIEDAIETQLGDKRSVLARAAAALELPLAPEANAYLDQLLTNFEESWRTRQPVPTP